MFYVDVNITRIPKDFSGTVIGGPVVPVILSVFWPKLTKTAVFAGSLGGTALALMVWLLTCRYYYGTINIQTLVANYSSLAGNLASSGCGAIISIAVSLMKPDNYDFSGTRSSMYNDNLN